MDKKEVLFVVHALNIGGVQKALIGVLHEIDFDRYNVTLYVRKDRCDLLNQVDPKVGKIIVNKDPSHYYRRPRAILLSMLLYVFGKFGRGAKWQDRLNRYVAESRMRYERKHYFSDGKRYDMAVSYIQGDTAAFVARYVDAKRKIMFFHGSVDESHALHEKIMPKYDKIVAVNADCRDILQNLYPTAAERIGFLENFADADLVRASSTAYTPDLPKDKLILCTCGRFTPVKGFDLAVGAAKILKERGVDFIWYFVGDGSERAKIQADVAANELTDCVRITGMLENPFPYIKSCDIYIQPSREESYGLTIREAQILRRPIITTATVGGKALIADFVNGLLADFSSRSLAEKIELLQRDDALRDRISRELAEIDHNKEKIRFRNAWDNLLE